MNAEVEARVRRFARAGDARSATREAIVAYSEHLLRYLHSILKDGDDVDDALAEVAESVQEGILAFRWESSLRSWMFRLARNAALDLRGDAWHRRGRRLTTTEASAIADDARTRSFARVERWREGLRQLLETLSEDDRSLIGLRIGANLSWTEIADVLSTGGQRLDENTLAKRFSRLKDHLSRMAKDRGLTD